jgi:alcohol dehydrogenase
MNKSNWNYPTTVWFGEGRIKDLHLACKQLKIKKPLLVTDNGLAQSQMVKKLLKDLNDIFHTTRIFSNIRGNPIGSNVTEGVGIF